MTNLEEQPAIELATKLRSAARRGAKLRLTPTQVALLMREPIYGCISALEAEEIRRACRAVTLNDNDISSVTSGSGIEPTPTLGASAGSNVIPLDAASRGASQLLREEAALMRRRKKP
jgi:hypothetical protein